MGKSETFRQCHDEYERPGGRDRGDRIVRCGKVLDHLGDHEEVDGGATWPREAADRSGLYVDQLDGNGPRKVAEIPPGTFRNGQSFTIETTTTMDHD